MIEHWFEYLPAAWWVTPGRWYVLVTLLIIIALAFAAGYFVGKRSKN